MVESPLTVTTGNTTYAGGGYIAVPSGGGSGSYTVNVPPPPWPISLSSSGYFVPPGPPDVFPVDGKALSSDELTELAKKVVTVFPEDATLVMVVDANWNDYQLSVLESVFKRMNRPKIVFIREPRKTAMVKVGPARTREERIDFLARIGIIWEDNPGLTLAEIIKTMAGMMLPSSSSPPVECEDEVIVSALELAWG